MIRVLMLGWEYPPHISGGLGTACEGLTKALADEPVAITFLLPRLFGGEQARHLRLVDATRRPLGKTAADESWDESRDGTRLKTLPIDSWLMPYLRPLSLADRERLWAGGPRGLEELIHLLQASEPGSGGALYGQNLFAEVDRFAERCLAHAQTLDFDLIHAHDWMTYPAALAAAKATGKPLILHVHSLETDRSGDAVNTTISSIERRALQQADTVIAVSHFTKQKIIEIYGLAEKKIFVVYNGVQEPGSSAESPKATTWAVELSPPLSPPPPRDRKTVLFLGRITFQKGPEYFVEVAAQVARFIPHVRFVMAGEGDSYPRVRELVRERGLEQVFEFEGFVKGRDRDLLFQQADLYIMPSVSEPFGITPLEALCFDVPVLISRQSGVSEVLSHVLKSDFWDVDEMADLVVGALTHGELRTDLMKMARQELKKINWRVAGRRTFEIYLNTLQMAKSVFEK
ncbi:MAG: 4-alpha-glucanotransferase [Bdellovibrio sp.]|nr:MAG: 4-alpha-glucanotransferase [Bdellovibrio sp.]